MENKLEEMFVRRQRGLCPFCKKEIIPEEEFKDKASIQEFHISGLCQSCQNKFFGVENG